MYLHIEQHVRSKEYSIYIWSREGFGKPEYITGELIWEEDWVDPVEFASVGEAYEQLTKFADENL